MRLQFTVEQSVSQCVAAIAGRSRTKSLTGAANGNQIGDTAEVNATW